MKGFWGRLFCCHDYYIEREATYDHTFQIMYVCRNCGKRYIQEFDFALNMLEAGKDD